MLNTLLGALMAITVGGLAGTTVMFPLTVVTGSLLPIGMGWMLGGIIYLIRWSEEE